MQMKMNIRAVIRALFSLPDHHLRHLILRCIAALVMTHHASAFAARQIECQWSAPVFNAIPAFIDVPNGATPGDVLTGWLDITQTTPWRCQGKSPTVDGGRPTRVGVRAAAVMPSGVTATIDGRLYPVFPLVGRTGVGYVARWRTTSEGNAYSDWQALDNSGSVSKNEMFAPSPAASEFTLGVQLQIRYIRTEGPLRRGPINGFDIAEFSIFEREAAGGAGTLSPDDTSGSTASVPAGLHQFRGSSTCQTTDNHKVDLGSIPISDLAATEGTIAGQKSFIINLLNCPPGWDKMFYTFTVPPGDILTKGVLRTIERHEGFGIQLRHGEYAEVVEFNIRNRLNAYHGVAGDYAINMTAALYRHGSSAITPGPFNAVAHYRIDYE